MKKVFLLLLIVFSVNKIVAQTNACGAGVTTLTQGATCSPTSGTSNGATGGGTGCTNGTNDDDVWYQFVATATSAIVTVNCNNNFDGVVACWTSCAATTAVTGGTCRDGALAGGVETLNLSGLTIGTTYFIQVYDWDSGSGGFTICVSSPPAAPANDNCSGAIPLTSGASCTMTSGTVAAATQSMAGCVGTADDDVWYSFTPTTAGQTINLNASGSMDPVVQIFSGGCGALSSLSCNDASYTTGGNGTSNIGGLTPGQTYYIRVYDYWSGAPSTTSFSICAVNFTPPPPNNQDCAGAIAVCQNVYNQATAYSGTGNVLNEINTSSCLSSGEKNDVWYQFTVQTSGNLSFNITPNLAADDYDWAVYNLTNNNCADIYTTPGLQVSCNFSGTAGVTGPNGGSASNSQGSLGTPGNATIPVTAGQTYVVNVSQFSTSTGGYNLNFGSSTAAIFDNVPPRINSLTATPGCGATSFSFNMSENIQCSTVSAADFSLSGPGGTYTVSAITGAGCAAGGASENTFTVTTTPAITTAGTYSLCLTNTAGSVTDLCGNVAPVACFTFTIVGPTVALTPTNPPCASGTGSISAVGSGGSGAPFTYSLNGGAFQSSGSFTGLAAGTYTVRTQDAGGCRGQATATITIPTPITATLTPTAAGCAGGGSITTTVSGGTGPYTYAWSPSGTGQNPTGLAPNNYTVTITGAGGCTGTATTTVGSAGTVTATFTNSANQCLNGNSFNFTNTGTGTSHSWTFPSGTPASSTSTNVTGVTWAAAGSYTVTHTATTGTCTATNTVQVTVFPRPNGPALTPTHPTCGANNGSIAVTAATGGTPNYQYNLNGGANSGPAAPTYNTLAGAPTTYTVNVTDANGCTNSSTVTLTNVPGPTAIATTTTTAHCGLSDGTITLGAVTGGTAAYQYSVTPTVGFSTTTAYTGQASGTHTITVRDNNNCTYTTTVNVPTTAGPTGPNATPVNSTCGNANGSVTLAPPTTPTPGASSYTYSFNGSGFTATTNYTGLAAGTYTYTIRDNFGCTVNGSVIVGNTAGPTALALTPTNASCGGANGQIAIGAVTGGTAAYTYSFNNPAGPFTATSPITALSAGTYSVTVRDANGCIFTTTSTINNSGGPTALVLTPTNANCGTANGSFTIGATTGGTGAMTYSVTGISGSFTGTTSYTGLAAGTYTVTVRDANGCTFTTNTTINNNAGPTALAVTPTNATCGLANGSFTIGATTGGTGPMTYSVTGISGSFTGTTSYPNLAANTYTVTVRDANGCTFQTTVPITNTPGPTAVVLTPTNSTCGLANGSFTIGAVTGGTAAYTYSVAPGPAGFTGTTTYSSLSAATYTVSVRDANACTYTTTVVVANTPGPTAVTLTPVNTSCGGTTGSLTIGAVTGGTSAYTYSVSPGPAGFNSTTSFTNIGAATYTVIVRDANNCQFTQTAVVGNNPGPTALALTPTNASCGGANGQIAIGAVTGGTAAYTYSFNNPAGPFTATSPITALSAGTYSVTVRDANGCIFTTTSTINNSGGPTALVLTPTNANCGTANGSFTIGATTGGTGAMTYSVTGISGSFTGTTSYTGLAAGTYTVTVRDANGCTFTTNTTINNNAGPTALAVTPTNATCGLANGSFTIGATTGGTGPMTYSVTGISGSFTGTTSYTGLAANTYTVTVRDANGCTFQTTVPITNTPGPTAVVLTPTNSTCGLANGSFTIGAVTGGTAAYTYSVAPGPAGFTGTTTYSSLSAATYTVSVRDANACTYTTTVVVANTPGPTAVTLTPVNTSCGGTTGSLTIGAVTGGTSAYTYSVSPGPAGFNSTTSFTNIGAATYTVIVRDANNCQFTQTAVVGNNPGPTAVVLTPVNSTCGASNGSFTIGAVTGGTAGFTYAVNGGASTGTTSYTGLAAGTYTVVVTDANSCTYTSNTTINNSGGPTAVTLTPVDATCGSANGSFTIGAVTGGAAAYSYSVNGSGFTATTSYTSLAAGTYTVVVRDANNCTFTSNVSISNSGGPTAQAMSSTNSACASNTGTVTFGATTGGTGVNTYSFNGSPFTGTTVYNNVAPGTYTAIVRDGNGCQFSTTVTVGTVAGPTAVVLTPTNSTCGNANGSFTIGAVTGGTAAYTYSVDGGAFTGTLSYSALTATTHTVVVRDANGCTLNSTVTIVNTPGPTAFAVSSVNSTCGNSNGIANAGAVTTSGSTTFQYSINGGALGAATSFTGLAAATYTLMVQDANGCQLTNTVTVVNTPGPTAQALTPTNSTCGNANGSVTIGATTGGTGAITYSFNGGAFSGTTTYNSLAAGTYTVVAQDANNCQFTQTTVVSNLPGPIALALTPTNATCGGANGAVTIGAVTGGSGTNTFSFNGSPFTATTSYTGLTAATYTVIVQDVNLCQFTQTVAVNNSGGPSAVVLTPTNSTCGNANGSIAVGAVTGGAGTITYSLDGGAFTSSTNYTGLASGTHTITVSDVNGCTFAQTTTINNIAGPTAVVLTPTNSTCGNANGSFTIGAVTGGTSAYTYAVNGGASSATTTYNSLAAGTYTVVVRDANNCTFTSNVTVVNTPGPTAFAVSSVPSTCGAANGVANAGTVTTAGSTTFQYSINGGALGASTSFTGLAAATYTLMVQDANGCQLTNTVVVTDQPGPTAQALTPVNSTCGNANGSVTIGATTGGTGLITYSFNGGAFSGTTSYTNLPAGTYTVVAQDANNCQFTQTTVVSNLPGPTALALTPTNATCGGSNGAVTIGAVTGGSGTNTYSFNGSPFTATISYTGLTAATYTVIVQDVNLCQFTQTVVVANSGGPSAVVLTPTNSTCGNANGSIAVGAVTGGSGTLSYSLNGGAASATTNYTGLAAGTYTITVSDVNGCTFSQTTTVNNTAGPTAVVVTPGNSTCGAANGTLTIGAVTGGTSGFTYSVNGSGFTATTSYTGLMAGTYTVIVQDANTCQFTQTASILDIPGPTALVLTPTNSTCSNPNGTLALGAVSGGTSPYMYSLNGAAFVAAGPFTGLTAATYTVVIRDANLCTYTVTTNVADTPGPTAQATSTTNSTCGNPNGIVTIGATTGGTAPYQFTFDGSALSATTSYTTTAGTHTVVVSDANACTFTVTATVNNTAGPTTVALTSTPSNCGNPNGVVTVGVVTGGTTPYEYSINGGASYQAGTSFPGLLANTYTITVRDDNNCTTTNTVIVNNLSSPTVVVASQTNVSCNGGNNGTVTLTGSGGASPYTFTLNTGQTNGSGVFNGLSATVYTVTITDAAGCNSTSTFTVTQPAVLAGSIQAQTNVSCFSGTNGSVTVTETGGTAPYTYSINGGAFGASATFGTLSATSYTVTVRDNLGCAANVPVTITQPTAIVLAFSSVNANCTDDNGTATVTPSGGTPGYTQVWTGGGGTAVTTVPVVAGTYSVTVTDANSCTATGNTTIGVTPGGTASVSNVTNVTCNGAANGSITVSMGGGSTAPFTYAWTPNVGTGATVSSLAPGTYSVTVTDDHGCVATTNASITEPIALAVGFTSTNVSCNAGSDGTINANVSGGTIPYTYAWSPGAFNTAIVSGLPVGTYTLTATDANGCVVTGTRTLVQPTALTITPTIVDPHCSQADGSATVVGGGGAGGYTFSINGGAFGAGSFTSLSAGTYTVTIKDGNQCTSNLPLTLVDQAGPTATITTSTNVSCNGGNNGSATVNATGGVTPYFYTWTPSSQTTQTANNLVAGVYGVVVRDASGCSAAASVIITEPAVLTINASGTDPICNGQTNGTGTSSAFGGTTPYTYQWAVLPLQNNPNATGLAAGTHVVTVTDALNCTASTSIILVNPPLLTATITKADLLCNSICNGTATAVTTNGTSPFLYSWNDPNAQTTQTASGLCAGSYTVNITDFKGCTTTASTTLTEPSLLTSTILNPVNARCAGDCNGSGSVSAAGGVGPYTYLWSNAATTATNTNLCVDTYTATVTDANGCTSQSVMTIVAPNPIVISASSTNASCYNVCDGTATATFSGGTAPYSFVWQPSLATVFNPTALCDGTHTVTITDANGCTQVATTTITEPGQLTASTIVNGNNICGQDNGSAQVQVTGGTSPFTYQWSNGATTAFISNLATAAYNVAVTDGNGCTVNTVALIGDIPGPTVIANNETHVSCFGLNNGTATVNVSGGTTPYASQTWFLPVTLVPNPDQSGNGLWPGINVFEVVDANGCSNFDTSLIYEPTQLVSLISGVNHAPCYGGTGNATMLVNGGTPNYSYSWSGSTPQNTATALGLTAGAYTCTVTDANMCTTASTVTIVQPAQLDLTVLNETMIDCYGNDNGAISVALTGGTPAYQYNWSPTGATGPSVSGLAPGSYILGIIDDHGCTTNSMFTITQPDSFKIITAVIPSKCSNPNGAIALTVNGASPAYTYLWNDGNAQTTSTATGLSAPAIYNCIITDSHGCTKNVTTSINDLPPPGIDSVDVQNVTCFGFGDGTATVYPKAGGDAVLTYAWYNSSNILVGNGSFQGGLPNGTYLIVVTDGNGCTVNSTATVTQPFPLSVTVSPNLTACNGQTLGIYASAAGGTPSPTTPNYNYTWTGAGSSLPSTGGNHNVLFTNTNTTAAIQTFSVSVTDSHNCPAVTGQFNVTVRPKISVIANDVTGCLGDDITLEATAGGGDGAPYEFTWGIPSPPVPPPTGTTSTVSVAVTSVFPETYSLSVSDGCSTPEQVLITVNSNPKPSAVLFGVGTEGCADLAVNFSGNGGMAFPGCTYLWNFGDGTTGSDSTLIHTYVADGLETNVYDVELTVTSPLGCVDVASIPAFVTVHPNPVAEFTFTPLETTEFDPEINFYNQSLLGNTYSWNFGEPISTTNTSELENPIHSYLDAGYYNINLQVTTDKGCTAEVEHQIYIQPEFAIYVPNAFTPNEDTKNEVFIPQGIGISTDRYHLYIYNRWGELIFESNDLAKGWDGTANGSSKIVQQDVYVWKILAYDLKNNKHNLTGHVTVVK